MATEFDPESVIAQTTDRLVKKYPAQDKSVLESLVRLQVEELRTKPIHDYIAVLAERAVKQQLKSEK